MRLKQLILWDIKFQYKYGFYLLYAFLTILYLVILFAFPESWREKASVVMIFSDPAAMGLFFMGAIVLLEKSQHIPCAYAVSPIRVFEYLLGEIITFCAISLVVAALLGIAAGVANLPLMLLGTALSSIIFTLLGIIVASNISSLNQFIIRTVPFELVCFIPALLHLFGVTPAWFRYYPVNVCIDFISGVRPPMSGCVLLVITIVLLFWLSCRLVKRAWSRMGGVKL